MAGVHETGNIKLLKFYQAQTVLALRKTTQSATQTVQNASALDGCQGDPSVLLSLGKAVRHAVVLLVNSSAQQLGTCFRDAALGRLAVRCAQRVTPAAMAAPHLAAADTALRLRYTRALELIEVRLLLCMVAIAMRERLAFGRRSCSPSCVSVVFVLLWQSLMDQTDTLKGKVEFLQVRACNAILALC